MKPKIKMGTDLFMTVLLLSLVAYQITGQELHEWFAALSINGPMATARAMHMAASYWGFVLIGIHIGFHWAVVMGIFRKLVKGKAMPEQ